MGRFPPASEPSPALITSTHVVNSYRGVDQRELSGGRTLVWAPYTKQIGVLRVGLLESPYSLTEVRTMFELYQGVDTPASELTDQLEINHGYLSRILKRFKSLGLVERACSPVDGRKMLLNLTSKGRAARANANVQHLLKRLSIHDILQLPKAMDKIRQLLTHATNRGQ